MEPPLRLNKEVGIVPTIEIGKAEFDALDLAASITGMSHAQVVARLIQQTRLPAAQVSPSSVPAMAVPIYADYEGYRTKGTYDQVTKRIDIADGPLAGQSFKSPSSAARAVVAHYKPGVSPHRNGWGFWLLDDESGNTLQKIR